MESRPARRRTGIAPVIASLVALQIGFGLLVGSAAFSPQAQADSIPVADSREAPPAQSNVAVTAAASVSATPVTPSVPATPETIEVIQETDPASTASSDIDTIAESAPSQTEEILGETVGLSPTAVSMFVDPVEFSSVRRVYQPEPKELVLVLGADTFQVFPVVGGGTFSSSFGAPRPEGRTHKGNDIFADKMTPVIAVAAGTVTWASPGPGERCCYVKIRHDDGSESLYLHLNNDTPGTDDGLGWGLADGIAKGAHVESGELIGFVGDSGNAEGTPSHLHFEYHAPNADAVDPNAMLKAALVTNTVGETPTITVAAETLPFTGIDSDWLVFIGLALVAGGLTTLGLSRRGQVVEAPDTT